MRRVLALGVAGLAACAVATAVPAPAATAGVNVSSLGSGVMSLYLDHAVTVPDAGLAISFGPVSAWGAVVIARQAPGSSRLASQDFVGVGTVSDGQRTVTVPFGSAKTLPGHYALYVLSPVGYRLSVRLAIPGVQPSSLATWSRQAVTVTSTLDRQLASVAGLSDRIPVKVAPGGAVVVLAATTGPPVAHDLAACLIEGAPPAGAEAKCGTTGMDSYRQVADVGPGNARVSLVVPARPAGSYTAVLRGEGTGASSGVAFSLLQWAWTAPLRTAVR